LFNKELRARKPDGAVETQVLGDAKALAAVLQERFGISVSDAEASSLYR
jgi:arylamine N-acetyltransferase